MKTIKTYPEIDKLIIKKEGSTQVTLSTWVRIKRMGKYYKVRCERVYLINNCVDRTNAIHEILICIETFNKECLNVYYFWVLPPKSTQKILIGNFNLEKDFDHLSNKELYLLKTHSI